MENIVRDFVRKRKNTKLNVECKTLKKKYSFDDVIKIYKCLKNVKINFQNFCELVHHYTPPTASFMCNSDYTYLLNEEKT